MAAIDQTGRPASQTPSNRASDGCKYEIDASKFLDEVNPASQHNIVGDTYNDVRANVIIGDAVFYVDRHGAAKTPDGYSTIDKERFKHVHIGQAACPNRQRA